MSVALSGCGEKVVKSDQIQNREGIPYLVNTDKPFTGKVQTFYKGSTKLKKVETLKNGKGDGVTKWWFENGQLEQEVFYKNGERNGARKRFFQNGQIREDLNYVNDKMDGLCKSWFENGQQEREFIFKDGKMTSKTQWDKSGQIIK